jgi:sulfate transport system substrate-binding protein
MKKILRYVILSAVLAFVASAVVAEPVTLLNASYDPTREFYEAYNGIFINYWKEKNSEDVQIKQSHGGSGKQARAVIDGLPADVVTLALAYDIDAIAQHSDLIEQNWQSKFPHDSSPYTSTIVFLVRKDNPKHIRDWDDLIREDVKVITPNPKTSGGARWNYLAAWGYAYKKNKNNETAAKEFVTKLFKNVPLLDTGARGSTTNFTKRDMGDVLITWENEALFITHDLEKGKYEIVVPSISILAEPPVAVVSKNVKKHKTENIAHAYLEHLYSKDAQELIAKFYYRPGDSEISAKYASLFPALPMLKISDFGGWKAAQEKHFSDGGIFDQIYGK